MLAPEMRRARFNDLLAWLTLLTFVACTPGSSLWEKLTFVKVKYHQLGRKGSGMGPFYEHGAALTQMAIDGNDLALKAFLEGANHSDGANSYTQFGLTIECLRKIEDERFARTIIALNDQTRERVWYYLSHVSDLKAQRPATHSALGAQRIPNPEALPLHDPAQIWP